MAEPAQVLEHFKDQAAAMRKAEEAGEAYYEAWVEKEPKEAREHAGEYIAINCEKAYYDRFNSHTIGHGISSARRAFRRKFGKALCWVRPIDEPAL
jgi:hypothetical protein